MNKQIVEKAKIHRVLFFQAVIYTGITGCLFYAHILLSVLGIFITLYVWLRLVIINFTYEFTITNKRLIMKTGLIRLDTLEISLQKLEAVSLNQSILRRILGYSAITIAGTGTTRMSFYNITNVREFSNRIESLRE